MNTHAITCLASLLALVTLASVQAAEPAPTQAQDASAPQSTVATTPAGSPIVDVLRSPMQLDLSPGVVNYESPKGGSETRLATSALLDWNFSPVGPVSTPLQYGLTTGLTYSHLGAPGSSFFGANSNFTSGGADGNLFVIPMNLWAGYYFENSKILLGLETGADLFLRSSVDSMALGRDADRTGGAADFFPAIGLKLAWDTSKNVALTARTHWALAPNRSVFEGLIGATVPLG